jgi:fatty acid synthase, animal type
MIAHLRSIGSVLQLVVNAALLGVSAIPAALLLQHVHARWGLVVTAVAAPFAYALWGFAFCTLVVVLKHAVRARGVEGTYPFFSLVVARWIFFAALASIANTLFVRFVLGTDFVVWWFRALGARIGSNVTIATIDVGDWDLLEVGDDAFVAHQSHVQAHIGQSGAVTFERTRIGARCTVGMAATIFAGAHLDDGVIVGAHAVVPKRARLVADTIYGGVPAVRIRARDDRGRAG